MKDKLIITFCGHSKLMNIENLEKDVFTAITAVSSNKPVIFYLGEYGDFDNVARVCACRYKELQPSSEIVFVTPYLDPKYIENKQPPYYKFDSIIYPGIERIPKKYAILERNKWLVKNSDYIIAFVNYPWGGAFKMLEYAKQQGKKCINLANKSY